MPTVVGPQGQQPEISFDTPLSVTDTQVEVIDEGDGEIVPPNATVLVQYHGVNGKNGKVFDSSYQRGAPVEFPLNGVIAGFRLGISDQKVGSRVLISVAPQDGYGPQGGIPQAGIGREDTLLFVVEILKVA